MSLDPRLARITETIVKRSESGRRRYLDRLSAAAEAGPARGHLSCSAQAHAYAGALSDQSRLLEGRAPNIGIITSYNDMLSAHQPFETYPAQIRARARAAGATAQVAGGVPAMCDGVTQGYAGMELSIFSRDVIALAAGVGLSHNTFDAALYLGVCDKIVPGLVIAAATFGHLPGIFVPAGPMPSGISNDEKAKVRQLYATGQASRAELMASEMAAYHSPGTCTFYGTANTNQMLMEFMGLHLPGASFIPPGSGLRQALTDAAVDRALQITALGNDYTPVGEVLDERAFVNGLVGLMATGGSTNLVLHLPAMARAAGIDLRPEDFAAVSDLIPLMAKVYPNGLADVNHFAAAGGTPWIIGQLLDAGLLHEDVTTVAGPGLVRYAAEPKILDGVLNWAKVEGPSANERILRPASDPFQPQGGLKRLSGNLGEGVMKISAVAPERHVVEAPARIFEDQEAVKEAFKRGEFTSDVVVVVRFQGPAANGMPELHSLTPTLAVLQDRGLRVALVTDGRMSGASGKVPSAIHVAPEAAMGGPLSRLMDGDLIRVDAVAGRLEVLTEGALDRPAATPDLAANRHGTGRELFQLFRSAVSAAPQGASVFGT